MIGKKISDYRKRERISQEELAEKIGVTRQTISNWELGETIPDINQAKNISKVLGISIDELTDNDIKHIVLSKITKNESNTKSILRITSATLVFSILFFLIFVGIISLILNYFKATPVGHSLEFECTIADSVKHYSIKSDMDNHITSFDTDDAEISDIDILEYKDEYALEKYIVKSVKSRNGICGELTE